MITAYIIYIDRTQKVLEFNTLSSALETVRSSLDVGDSFIIREGNTLLAKGKIEEYKEGNYE